MAANAAMAVVATGPAVATTPQETARTSTTSPAADAAPATDPATAASRDSIAAAFATVWGSYLMPQLDNDYPQGTRERELFMRGITESFHASLQQEAYCKGMLQGFTVIKRLESMRELGFPIDDDTFLASLTAMMQGNPTGFTPAQADHYLNAWMSRRYEMMAAADTVSQQSQRQYIDSIAATAGAVTTPSGLVFIELEPGEGTSPGMSDEVALQYEGKLWDGTQFDRADEPVVFPVNGLVPGFGEALTMMRPGGRYRIVIPSALGYGSEGFAGVIPGNAALDFTITLLRVMPPR